MDIAKSFTFMFEDPEWLRKLGIGFLVVAVGLLFSVVLIGLIPLIIVLGYTLDVTRNVMDGQPNPLPEWNDWEGFLMRGLKLAGSAGCLGASPDPDVDSVGLRRRPCRQRQPGRHRTAMGSLSACVASACRSGVGRGLPASSPPRSTPAWRAPIASRPVLSLPSCGHSPVRTSAT